MPVIALLGTPIEWTDHGGHETATLNGLTVHVKQDDMAENPRTAYDNLGHMVAGWCRDIGGDKDHDYDTLADAVRTYFPEEYAAKLSAEGQEQGLTGEDLESHTEWEEVTRDGMEDILSETWHDQDKGLCVPFSRWGHYGDLSCRGEKDASGSGADGFLYVSYARLASEYGPEFKTKESNILACLKGEIETLAQYCTGDTWIVDLTKPCASCGQNIPGDGHGPVGGFYGLKWAKEEAESVLRQGGF